MHYFDLRQHSQVTVLHHQQSWRLEKKSKNMRNLFNNDKLILTEV